MGRLLETQAGLVGEGETQLLKVVLALCRLQGLCEVGDGLGAEVAAVALLRVEGLGGLVPALLVNDVDCFTQALGRVRHIDGGVLVLHASAFVVLVRDRGKIGD